MPPEFKLEWQNHEMSIYGCWMGNIKITYFRRADVDNVVIYDYDVEKVVLEKTLVRNER